MALGVALAALLGALGTREWYVRRTNGPRTTAGSPYVARVAERPPGDTHRATLPRGLSVTLVAARSDDEDSHERGYVEGRVVARGSGRGVASATLTFLRDGRTVAATTDAQGTFHWAPDAEGVWTLLAVSAPGFLTSGGEAASALLTVVARRGVATRGVVVALSEAFPYVGVVRAPDGTPVADATVRVLDERGDAWRSGADGTFTFTAEDGAAFEVTHEGYAPGFAMLDLAAQSSHRLTLRLGPRTREDLLRTLVGSVFDEGGAPVVGALVTVNAPRDAIPRDDVLPGWRVRTAEDGSFRVEAVPAGRYEVTATDGVHAPARRSEVTPEEGPLRLTMLAGRRLMGRVLDGRTGRAMSAFTVIAAAMRGIERVGAPTVRTVVDGRGEFELGGLELGRYVVRAVASDHGASDEQSVDLGDTDTRITLVLPAGGVLTGTVRDRTTLSPIEGARVSLEGHVAVADVPVDLIASASTDARGRFELAGVTAGLRSVMAVAEGHHARVLSGLRVEDGRVTDPLELDLTPVEDGGVAGIELAGIGAVLGARGDVMVIGRVLEGGGAAEVGLRAGDAVMAVEGVPVRTLGFEGTIQRIRGPEGSVVHLTVVRDDAGAVEIAVPRRRIRT